MVSSSKSLECMFACDPRHPEMPSAGRMRVDVLLPAHREVRVGGTDCRNFACRNMHAGFSTSSFPCHTVDNFSPRCPGSPCMPVPDGESPRCPPLSIKMPSSPRPAPCSLGDVLYTVSLFSGNEFCKCEA